MSDSISRNVVESAVAEIWSDVLGLAQVGGDEDFFALGGTSLHAARVLTKTRAAFGVKLSPQDLVEHPTLAAYAAQVAAAGPSEGAG